MNSKMFEAMLKVAAQEAEEREMASLSWDTELEEMFPPSDILDKRIKNIIAKESKANKRKRFLKTFVNVAASVCVLFTLGSLVVMGADFLNISAPGAVAVGVEMPAAAEAPEAELSPFVYRFRVETDMEPLPFADDRFGVAEPSPAAGDFRIYQMEPSPAAGEIWEDDMEMQLWDYGYFEKIAGFSVIYINERRVYYFEGDFQNTVMWEQDGQLIELISMLDMNELLAMAEKLF